MRLIVVAVGAGSTETLDLDKAAASAVAVALTSQKPHWCYELGLPWPASLDRLIALAVDAATGTSEASEGQLGTPACQVDTGAWMVQPEVVARWLGTKEIAGVLGISVKSAERLLRDRGIRAGARKLRGKWRALPEHLDRLGVA